MKQYIKLVKNVICGRLSMILSIDASELESIIGASCWSVASNCSANMSADMNATLANDAAEKINAESRADIVPNLNVSELSASVFSDANLFMKYIISQMHPPNLAVHNMKFSMLATKPGIPDTVTHWLRNIYAVETPPNASPAIPAVFHMFLVFITLYIIP